MMRLGFQILSHFSLENRTRGSLEATSRISQGRKEEKGQKEMRQEKYREKGIQPKKNQRKRENQTFPSQEFSKSWKFDSKTEIEKWRKEPKERGKTSVLKMQKKVEERRNEESSFPSLFSSRQEKEELVVLSKEVDFEKANQGNSFSGSENVDEDRLVELKSEEPEGFVLEKSFDRVLEKKRKDCCSEMGPSVHTDKN